MNRRAFLAMAGLALLADAARADDTPLAQESAPLDVAVIGAGLAGLSAAAAAHEAGAGRVAVFEKEAVVGGHSALSTGYFSAVRRLKGPEAEYRKAVEEMIRDMKTTGKNRGDPKLVRIVAEQSGNAYEWLSRIGVFWLPTPYEALGGMAPRSYLTSFVRGGYDLVLAVNRLVRKRGIPVSLSSRVEDIERKAGSWFLTVKDIRGRKKVEAKAIVIATGGFTGNVSLRTRYDPRLTSEIHSTADPYGDGHDSATGDGILLGQRLGADTIDMESILTIPFSGGRLTNYVGADIYLDENGKRFVSEQASMSEISDAVWKLPNHRFWVLTDAQSQKGASRNVKLIRGIVKTARTLDEASRGMGIPPAVLRDTVSRYNSYARRHKDPEFGRTLFTQEITTPPFYFGLEQPFVHFCNGGLRISPRAEVLDKGGNPIGGIFAAGEVTGGVHGAGRLGGCSLPDCVVFGRIAGYEAAKLAGKKAR